MTRKTSTGGTGRRGSWTIAALAGIGGLAAVWAWSRGMEPEPQPLPAAEAADAAATGRPSTDGHSADGALRAPAPSIPATPETPAGSAGGCGPFQDMWRMLQGKVRGQWRALQGEDLVAAERMESELREDLAQLQRCHPDLGLTALERLSALPAPGDGADPASDWHLLLTLVRCSLQKAWQQRGEVGGADRCDQLAGAALALVPQDPASARDIGLGLLADQPYLGLAHEEAVLHLVEAAATRPDLREASTRLLQTLWRNLAAQRARPSEQLETLALLYLEDANPIRRRAACLHLFLRGSARSRELVLAETLRRGDRDLAAQLARAAGTELRGRQGMIALERLAPLAGTHATHAIAQMVTHSPQAVRHSYEQHLVDNRSAELRRDWITGAALLPSPEGLALAQMALERDPNREVRERAMFAITAQGNSELAERALRRVLPGPELRGSSAARSLGVVVLGLENALAAGHREVVLRFAGELTGHPMLAAADRKRLAELSAAAAR